MFPEKAYRITGVHDVSKSRSNEKGEKAILTPVFFGVGKEKLLGIKGVRWTGTG